MAKKRKKNINRGPRRKKLTREGRLKSAKQWLEKYKGNNIIRGYKKWYGLDAVCAITELRLLGIPISDERMAQAKLDSENLAKHRKTKKEMGKRKEAQSSYKESDENFSDIIGYTSGGAPYGVTWDEAEEEPD